MKHTPGPWHIAGGGKFVYALNEYETNRFYLSIYGQSHKDSKPTSEEIKANAALIAAAPDLLEALIAVVDMGYNDSPDVWKQVDAAIAKATAQSVE